MPTWGDRSRLYANDLATRAKHHVALIFSANIASASVGRNKNTREIWESRMKRLVKFVAGMLFVATTSVSQLSYGEAAMVTRDLIAFMGIPFDVPGSADAVKNLCVIGKDITCNFSEDGTIFFPNLAYGNLSFGAKSARVNKDGSLVQFSAIAYTSELVELSKLLTEKYGLPNGSDARLFIWIDRLGTSMIVKATEIRTLGTFTITSRSEMERKFASDKAKNEANKSKL